MSFEIDYGSGHWLDELAGAIMRRNRALRAARNVNEPSVIAAITPVPPVYLNVVFDSGMVRRVQAFPIDEAEPDRANQYELRYHGVCIAVDDPEERNEVVE